MNKMNIKSFGLVLATCFGLIGCAPTSEPTSTPSVEEPTTVPATEPTTVPTTEVTTESQPTSEPTISVETGVILEEMPAGTHYSLGDRVYDFTVKDIYNNYWDLLTAVNTKKLVVINFFASWCGPCQAEMPAMEEAYREYSDDVDIIALSVEADDTPNALKSAFINRYNLTFNMAIDGQQEILSPFLPKGTTTFYIPYTVLIDRYGMLVAVHNESIPNAITWKSIFNKYIGDDYLPQTFDK